MVSQNNCFQNKTIAVMSLCLCLMMTVMVEGSQGYAPYIRISTERKTAQRRQIEGRKRTRPRPKKTVDLSRRRKLSVQSENDGDIYLTSNSIPSQASLWGTSVSTAFRKDPTRNMIENLLEVSSVVETESLETLEKH